MKIENPRFDRACDVEIRGFLLAMCDHERPFELPAKSLTKDEQDDLEQLQVLCELGLVRRLGGRFAWKRTSKGDAVLAALTGG